LEEAFANASGLAEYVVGNLDITKENAELKDLEIKLLSESMI